MGESELTAAAQVLSQAGASKGGKARAEKLTPEERRDIARTAASARWNSDIPLAEYEGEMPFAGVMVPCAVLPDGTRVLSERGVARGFGLKRGGSTWKRRDESGARLPVFASANNLKPFISPELSAALTSPILYRPASVKGSVANGIRAEVVPLVCEMWIDAKNAGALHKSQFDVAEQAYLVLKGLAHVGIIALVDEATGYQADRARDALALILEEFISKELGKWAQRFPDEFYRHLFRLKGLRDVTELHKRPRYFGILTNNIIYRRIAPGVLAELQRVVPKDSKGRRKYHFHRRLTEDIGHPKLQEHLAAVITIQRLSDSWDDFMTMLDRAHPVWRGNVKQPIIPGL